MTETKIDQDWEKRVIKKGAPKTIEEKLKTGAAVKISRQGPNKQDTGATILSSKVANDFDPENISKPATSTLELKLALQQARTAKKWTQTKLDQACNFPSGTVKDYENGTAVISPIQLNKMNTVLGVKLPRPSKKKVK
jgi:putative transcription factor